MRGQWRPQNSQKSSKILKSPPQGAQGASPWRPGGDFLPKEVTFTKHQYLLCLRHILPAQGALGYSFGPQSRPKGAPMPLFGRLGGSLKMSVFLEGSRSSLWLQNGTILGPIPPPGTSFWYLFRVGTPKSLDTLKSQTNVLKRTKNASKIQRNDRYRV